LGSEAAGPREGRIRTAAIVRQTTKARRIFCIDVIAADLLVFVKNGVPKNIRIPFGKSTGYSNCRFVRANEKELLGGEERLCGSNPVWARNQM
jgi:hypothetical protein